MQEWVCGHIGRPENRSIESHPEQPLFHGPDGDSFAIDRTGHARRDAIDGEQAKLITVEVADLNAVVEGSQEDAASGF